MSNSMYMTASFEKEKNIKAGMYTGIVCAALLIVFFFAKWTLPVIPQPVVEEGIEVNLGNSDEGLGDIAPQVPGEPAAAAEESYTPPQTQQPVANDEPDIATDDNDPEAPEISKPVKKVVKTPAKPVTKTEVVSKPRPNTTPVTNPTPTPAPPRPKAVYKGGTNTGTGGNGADTYNDSRNQGIAGGRGDQGSPNGNPNSDSYKGNASRGNSGVRITRGLGGRSITRYPSFEDDFNENAKVAVDIRVDQSGRVVSAVVNPRGTTTTNAGIKSIATRKAMQLKLNAGGEDEQTGTIVFDFKLRG
jgi:outer membrane biosynthesis protein TonB